MSNISDAHQALARLKDPSFSLPKYGQVLDQKTSQFIPYDPKRITKTFQSHVLDYFSNPARTEDGLTVWMTYLTARQMGKSLAIEYACYPHAAYNPGWDHVCIADNGDRAKYLHGRIHQLHTRWPREIRAETIPNKESRQLTFRPEVGGKMRVLSAESGAVGVGQSPDSFHASECAFWRDFSGSMFMITPSLINRQNALVAFECTPWEAGSDWHDHCIMAKKEVGRHRYHFSPFWDSQLNERNWNPQWNLDNAEIKLLNEYAGLGLGLRHLAFRRELMDTDSEIRRRPELFRVFYPFDDVSCWISSANQAFPDHVLAKHLANRNLSEWLKGDYQEYEAPQTAAIYAIGADPSGHAARDHASFQVLKVYEGEWTQVAVFATHVDPMTFAKKLYNVGIRYNKALIVVESNGVGQGIIVPLRHWNYPRLFWEKRKKPGFTTTGKSLNEMMGWTTDALMEELIIHDKDTVQQLQSYKSDKIIEEGVTAELSRGTPNARRRDRHHWDKISALMMAIVGARSLPQRKKPAPTVINLGKRDSSQMTRAQWEEYYSANYSPPKRKHDPWYGKRKK